MVFVVWHCGISCRWICVFSICCLVHPDRSFWHNIVIYAKSFICPLSCHSRFYDCYRIHFSSPHFIFPSLRVFSARRMSIVGAPLGAAAPGGAGLNKRKREG